MAGSKNDETYSDEETVRRREAALKRMLSTPPTHKLTVSGDDKPKRGRPKKVV